MKKFLVIVLLLAFWGSALPMDFFGSNSDFLALKEASAKSTKSTKEKDTKKRIKRLSSLGVPKYFYRGSYGKDLSLREMGQIISDWIVSYYNRTGQLPPEIMNNSATNDWLVLNVGGQCVSSGKLCERWREE